MKRMNGWIRGLLSLAVMITAGIESAGADFLDVEFGGETWRLLRGRHFVVYYDPSVSASTAADILRAGEEYYREIGEVVGFTRYSDFWTWDQRAKIFIFSDQRSFQQRTGAPSWSTGYADRDSYLFQSRAIVTYLQEAGWIEGLLPHEISHLILHDFIPTENLPVWIDEGIAQLFEKDKHVMADRIMRSLVRRGQSIPLRVLNRWDIRQETDAVKVEVFYAQSLSLVRFLREEFGYENFCRFCRSLRDGKSLEEALQSAYPVKIRGLDDLQAQWRSFINNGS